MGSGEGTGMKTRPLSMYVLQSFDFGTTKYFYIITK